MRFVPTLRCRLPGVSYFHAQVTYGDKTIHVRAHRALPHAGGAVTLHSVQAGKTVADPIVAFSESITYEGVFFAPNCCSMQLLDHETADYMFVLQYSIVQQ